MRFSVFVSPVIDLTRIFVAFPERNSTLDSANQMHERYDVVRYDVENAEITSE